MHTNLNFENDKIVLILQIILAQFYSKYCATDPVDSRVEIRLVFFHLLTHMKNRLCGFGIE